MLNVNNKSTQAPNQKNKQMGRIFHQENVHQLNILDDRFYTEDFENYYPSVTTVLEVMPDGYGLTVWKKDLGHAADEVLRRAGTEGRKVHDAIQAILEGYEIKWIGNGFANRMISDSYNLSEWQSISKFIEFWEAVQPQVIALELKLLSVNLRLGGQIDLICRIKGEIWIIDYKTSNYMHESFWLQISAYASMWNEQHPEHMITRCGILHLKSEHRGPDKTGKSIQGKGWKLYPMEDSITHHFDFFQVLRQVWDRENPDYKPKNLKFPDRYKLNTIPSPEVVIVKAAVPAGMEPHNVGIVGKDGLYAPVVVEGSIPAAPAAQVVTATVVSVSPVDQVAAQPNTEKPKLFIEDGVTPALQNVSEKLSELQAASVVEEEEDPFASVPSAPPVSNPVKKIVL